MREVTGKNRYTFHQGREQHGDNRGRHDRSELTHGSAHKQQRCERHHGRQHRRDHRGNDFHGAIDRGLQVGLTHLPVSEHVLANHDGIINNNPQCHHECEHGDLVECLPG